MRPNGCATGTEQHMIDLYGAMIDVDVSQLFKIGLVLQH
jgi:hypothetical protein